MSGANYLVMWTGERVGGGWGVARRLNVQPPPPPPPPPRTHTPAPPLQPKHPNNRVRPL